MSQERTLKAHFSQNMHLTKSPRHKSFSDFEEGVKIEEFAFTAILRKRYLVCICHLLLGTSAITFVIFA